MAFFLTLRWALTQTLRYKNLTFMQISTVALLLSSYLRDSNNEIHILEKRKDYKEIVLYRKAESPAYQEWVLRNRVPQAASLQDFQRTDGRNWHKTMRGPEAVSPVGPPKMSRVPPFSFHHILEESIQAGVLL